MFKSERKVVIAAGWCFVVLGGWALLLPLARAEDKKPQRQIRVELRATAAPVLAKIPYVNRLFAISEEAYKEQQAEKCAAEDLERIGVDFECPGGVFCPIGKLGQCHIICVSHLAETGEPDCKATSTAEKCASCAAGECPACVDETAACCADLTKLCCAEQAKFCCAEQLKLCSQKCQACSQAQVCEQFAKCADFDVRQCSACEQDNSASQKMAEVVAELRIQNAILEAKMSAQEEVYKARVEILQQWARLVADKTKIEAELAFTRKLADQRDEVCQQVLALKTEKNELESLVRAAEERRVIEVERIELASENEKLKKRVAELEQLISARPSPYAAPVR